MNHKQIIKTISNLLKFHKIFHLSNDLSLKCMDGIAFRKIMKILSFKEDESGQCILFSNEKCFVHFSKNTGEIFVLTDFNNNPVTQINCEGHIFIRNVTNFPLPKYIESKLSIQLQNSTFTVTPDTIKCSSLFMVNCDNVTNLCNKGAIIKLNIEICKNLETLGDIAPLRDLHIYKCPKLKQFILPYGIDSLTMIEVPKNSVPKNIEICKKKLIETI